MKYRVRMLKTENATDGGYKAEWYRKGQEYSIGERLFNAFKEMGVIELVDEVENKMEPSPVPTPQPVPQPVSHGRKGKKGRR